MQDKFKPYEILPIQLKDLGSYRDFIGNKYIIIWVEKIPLGHIWLTEGSEAITFEEEVKQAISKSIHYYLPDLSSEILAAIFTSRDYGKLHQIIVSVTSQQQPPSKKLSVSVIVCTRNRASSLEKCIFSLSNSSDQDFELIVVDNCPDDNLTELVVQKYPFARYIKENRKGLDIARNTGALCAKNEIVAYTDDDVEVDVDWIKNLKSCFDDPLTMAVTGLVIPVSLQAKAQVVFEQEYGFNKGYLPITFDHRYFLERVHTGVPTWNIGAGANMAFRKEAFSLFGFFDERLDVGASGCSGDSEYWYKVLAEGWNCCYFPHLFVYHSHRDNLKSLHNQLYHYMRGHVSALMVQYQKYGHNGNVFYLRNTLFNYYYRKAKHLILHERFKGIKTLVKEIKGSCAGWLYFQLHQKRAETKISKQIPISLTKNVEIRDNALVSVIIPCYNHAHYLQQAIDSVFNQSHQAVEVIVVNDGSTDHTEEICQKNPLVRYIETYRVGLSAARNVGVSIASGEFVVFLDADDFLLPDALKINLSYFYKYPQAAFVYGAYDKIDQNGNSLEVEPARLINHYGFEMLLYGNLIAMEATVMYRKDLFFTFHFDPKLKACEDYDLNLQIARYLPIFGHAEKIAVYRIHTNNMSLNTNVMLSQVLLVLRKQKPLLGGKHERTAYRKGKYHWRKYYRSMNQ